MMKVTDAVLQRRSVRAFLERPVEESVLYDILHKARRAPSGGNLQPWHVDVVTGDTLSRLKAAVGETLAATGFGEGTEFAIYPDALDEPYRSRRKENGEQLYASIGVAREDKAGRFAQFTRNFDGFGAPCLLFFSLDRSFDRPQWVHLGMFIQTIMLLAQERGLDTCAQESWAAVHKTVSSFLDLPPNRIFYCGLALGHPDMSQPINGWVTERAEVADFVRFHG